MCGLYFSSQQLTICSSPIPTAFRLTLTYRQPWINCCGYPAVGCLRPLFYLSTSRRSPRRLFSESPQPLMAAPEKHGNHWPVFVLKDDVCVRFLSDKKLYRTFLRVAIPLNVCCRAIIVEAYADRRRSSSACVFIVSREF